MVLPVGSEYLTCNMIYLIKTILLCVLTAQGTDETVLSAVERFFYRSDFQQAAEMIDSHQWLDSALWGKAGLLRELCDQGWSFACPAMPQGDFQPFSTTVSINLSGEFLSGDSVRVLIPLPVELPWQTFVDSPEINLTGISGVMDISSGLLTVQGISEGVFEVVISQSLKITPPVFPGPDIPGSNEAMVPFPGESVFFDICLNTDVFWAGEDVVYMESTVLAAREPNPMRLVQRIIDYVNAYYSGSSPVTHRILLEPSSELAIAGEMYNSLGGATLGAAILRRWQIPAFVVPGRFGNNGSMGFLLATYVKPFGWMVISPYPDDFTAIGTFEHPLMNSWFNGIDGVTYQAEFLGADGLWHAVPVNEESFIHSVEINTQ